VIVRVRVVLERTVVRDRRFDNLSGSHFQSQVNSVCQSMVLKESQISVEHFVSGFVDYTYLPGEDH